jgi:plasmid maintenance system antidote protein VapI
MDRPKDTITDVLRRTIAASGMALIAIERATGVKRASVMRFLRGRQSLRLDMADRLADFFGLELRPKRKGR